MVTPEDHKKLRYLGRASVMTQLATLTQGGALSAEGAESYATGMADGIREFATAFISEGAAYNMLQEAADRTGAHRGVAIGTEPSSP